MRQTSRLSQYKNFIFDLGGVILNLSVENTLSGFATLASKSLEEIQAFSESAEEFKLFEKGKLSDVEFRSFLNRWLQTNVSDYELDVAWNAMLGEVPLSRLNTLMRLREKRKIFLLSNTNIIHQRAFQAMKVSTLKHLDLSLYFDKVYFSHEVGMRKPDTDVFLHILNDRSLVAADTIFIDDTIANIDTAARLGLGTYHVTNADEFFKELDFAT